MLVLSRIDNHRCCSVNHSDISAQRAYAYKRAGVAWIYCHTHRPEFNIPRRGCLSLLSQFVFNNWENCFKYCTMGQTGEPNSNKTTQKQKTKRRASLTFPKLVDFATLASPALKQLMKFLQDRNKRPTGEKQGMLKGSQPQKRYHNDGVRQQSTQLSHFHSHQSSK